MARDLKPQPRGWDFRPTSPIDSYELTGRIVYSVAVAVIAAFVFYVVARLA